MIEVVLERLQLEINAARARVVAVDRTRRDDLAWALGELAGLERAAAVLMSARSRARG